MSARAEQLALRRQQLQERCARERQHVAAVSQAIESRLGKLDRGFNFASLLTRRPVLIAVGVAGMFIFGPARMWRWLGRGTLLIGALRRLGGFITRL